MDVQKPARVLVVDDEIRALRLMSRVLGSCGIACTTAESAAEAMEQLRKEPSIDVVVSDIYMPTTDGIEFLGTVRRDFEDRPWLQLLLVTGQASLETAVAAMRLEASDYLIKPIDPKSLREAVQHGLTRAESIRNMRGMAFLYGHFVYFGPSRVRSPAGAPCPRHGAPVAFAGRASNALRKSHP